jgi:ribosomal-protein-alanine N-acetyltransferase
MRRKIMSICIETERLVLRQFSVEDAIELNKICNEAYILKWMPDWKSSVDDMKGWIGWVDKQYSTATLAEK